MPGGYVKNIENQFGLGRPAAEKYATLVFASSFRLEMSKRWVKFILAFLIFQITSLRDIDVLFQKVVFRNIWRCHGNLPDDDGAMDGDWRGRWTVAEQRVYHRA